ncbi:hypothetical protein ACWD7Y_04700 [Streptomyces drozdowiczii]
MSGTKIKQCVRAADTFVVVRHLGRHGELTHATSHPNLVSPTFFGYGRNAGLNLVRPGYFCNETGAAAPSCA